MSCDEILAISAKQLVENGRFATVKDALQSIRETTKFDDSDFIDKNYTRLSWDEYFMSLAFLVRMRSPDSQTQHGAVIVDDKNKIVSTGYNGFLPDAADSCLPNMRPYKLQYVMHAEVNAILSASCNLEKCKIYVTGLPCNDCLKMIIKSGIRSVIVGDIKHVYKDGYFELQSLLCVQHEVVIRYYTGKIAHMQGREITNEDHKNWIK